MGSSNPKVLLSFYQHAFLSFGEEKKKKVSCYTSHQKVAGLQI